MHGRNLASLAALAVTALTLGVGCPDENAGSGTPTTRPTTRAPSSAAATTASPGTTGTGAAVTGTSAAATGATGTIKGVVNFTGTAPEMKVPAKRKDAEFCKDKQVKYNAVLATGGKLQDVFVRLPVGAVKGKFDAQKTAALVNQQDCMYAPRIQGVVSGQDITIKNSDATLHNVHTHKGAETLFNQAQPKGSDPITKNWEDEAIIKFTCDVHPW